MCAFLHWRGVYSSVRLAEQVELMVAPFGVPTVSFGAEKHLLTAGESARKKLDEQPESTIPSSHGLDVIESSNVLLAI